MKKITTFFCLCFIVKFAFPQAQGTFIYESDYSSEIATGKVITKIYESKSMARIESNNTSTKSSLGPPKSADQNVILMNFDNSTETHLNVERKTAIITKFTVVMQEESLKKIGTEYSVQNLGQEKVGNYSCTHFVIVSTNPKNKAFNAKKDIWVTKDIGIGNVYFVGSYLYYPKGSIVAQKLSDAGADGIVVKWQISDPLMKETHVCNLISYQSGQVSASMFAPPSGYQVIHNENMTPPSH
jgi:uncharacterized protein DUF4412